MWLWLLHSHFNPVYTWTGSCGGHAQHAPGSHTTLPSTHTRVLLASHVLSQHKCPMTAGPLGDSCIMGSDVPTVLGGEQRLVDGTGELTHQGPAGHTAPWSQSCRPRPGIHPRLEAGHPSNCLPSPSLEPQGHPLPCNPTPKDRSPQLQSLGNTLQLLPLA